MIALRQYNKVDNRLYGGVHNGVDYRVHVGVYNEVYDRIKFSSHQFLFSFYY